MRVGIDNYGLFPLRLSPVETLVWATNNGSEGVAFSGIDNRPSGKFSSEILSDLKQYAKENNLFLEWGGGQHLPWDITLLKEKSI